MTIIFKCKTDSAYHIKILSELLAQNIKTGCFEITESGISLSMMDHHRRVLIDLILNSDNFSIFKFKHSGKLYVGVNLSHLHKMLKSVKKKDSLELFIDDDNPTELGIRVMPKENNRISTSYIKIQNIQNILIDMPTGYAKPVIVSSSEIQKLFKDMSNIGNTVRIVAKDHFIQFECDAGGVLKRTVQFGEIDPTDDIDSSSKRSPSYSQEFSIEQLCRITKIAGFAPSLQIYPGYPILFRSNIGSLGRVSVYIKSKEQIEHEACSVDTGSDTD